MSNFPAGSKIIVTKPDRNETYKKGDIFTVANTNTNGGCGVYVTHKDAIYYVSNREFEAYTEPFKIGDLVEVTAENAEWEYSIGDKGTVDYIDTHEPKIRLNGAGYIFTSDLKLVEAEAGTPRAIAYTDIQQGDTIRAEYTQYGVKYNREGVAHETFGSTNAYWGSDEGGLVADTAWNATYTLLERPKPPKPNPFASLPLGTLAKNKRQVWQKSAANQWRALYVHALQEDCGVTDEDALREEWEVIFNPLTS